VGLAAPTVIHTIRKLERRSDDPMAPRKTLAMVLTAPRTLEPREFPLPEIDDDSALLRVEACGICGSDYEQFEGVLRTPLPVIPGHEPLGTIEAIGDRAARRWGVDVGDRVAVETMLSCRFCAAPDGSCAPARDRGDVQPAGRRLPLGRRDASYRAG
jgi:NADPH:quinone reductase-like Zn-dependent oxidoreductase